MARLRLAPLALVIVCLWLTGCVKSSNPFSDPARSAPDKNMIGLWKEVGKKDASLVAVGLDWRARVRNQESWKKRLRDVPPGLMVMRNVEWNEEQELEPLFRSSTKQSFFPSVIGSETYLNALQGEFDKDIWSPTKITGYRVIRYRVTGDTLELWTGSEEGVAAAVESGGVRGAVTRDPKDKRLQSAELTDTTQNLAKYIVAGGGKVLFPDRTKKTYQRVKLP
ncbi:MAG TPA: hypothetical protein VGE74_11080 [Gemmata sp.]